MVVMVHRAGLVLCVASIAGVIVWYTPLPASSFPDCNRPCHELDWPMICRFKFHVQYYDSFRLCHRHTSCPEGEPCSSESCEVLQDVHLINGNLLGPTMQVCKNDILVIDVINRVPSRSLSFHWHGQHTRETPSMDGVSMVTQCPVLSHTVYQYKLRAAQAGTHYYHALTGDAQLDSALQGGIIVRESRRQETHRQLYDEDHVNYTVHISQHKDTLFVNGKSLQSNFLINTNTRYRFRLIHGGVCPLILSISHPLLLTSMDGTPVFLYLTQLKFFIFTSSRVTFSSTPTPGTGSVSSTESNFLINTNTRYRFRLIHGGVCPVILSIASHPLLIIAMDGSPVAPKMTEAVEFAPGERVDFIVTANKPVSTYDFNFKPSSDQCLFKLKSKVQLVYNATGDAAGNTLADSKVKSKVIEESSLKSGKTSLISTIQSHSKPHTVTLDHLSSADSNQDMLTQIPDVVLTLEYYKNDFNNISFLFPPSPLISQLDQVDPHSLCDSSGTEPRVCSQERLCQCTHVIRVPLKSLVQVTLVDKGNMKDHVFHLHGHSFHLVRRFTPPGTSTNIDTTSRSGPNAMSIPEDDTDAASTGVDKTSSRDKGPVEMSSEEGPVAVSINGDEGRISTVSKDTIGVARGQAATIRFHAQNPGVWSLHSQHNLQHQVLFQVGEPSDLPPTPQNFPTCGNYIGPEFFLI
ncbi:hypothetical protein M8J77_017488 [Diaphorina citri]|nr:hypothetical protein M8J77_017488 [Diaphorina citri]